MPTMTVEEIVNIMADREEALASHVIIDRFKAALPELEEDDLQGFVNKMIKAIAMQVQHYPVHEIGSAVVGLAILVGLELGRELERRV